MGKKAARWVLVCVPILAITCNLTRPVTYENADDSVVQTRASQEVSATLTAYPTPTQPPFLPTSTPVPAQPTASATPIPASPVATATAPVPDTYAIEEQRRIDGYTIRLWRNTADDGWGFDGIATISVGEGTLAQIEGASAIGAHTGDDITGEGHPDVVIETYSGGAHCCFGTIVYDLGPNLTRVLESPQSNCGGHFEDLNGDGVLEFVTCDDLFAYAYCPYAVSPVVMAILQYMPGDGYIPARPSFAYLYAEPVVQHTEMAETAEPGEFGEWDETTKCGVLPLMLDYLYTGQAVLAWMELDRLYDFPDGRVFWAELERGVEGSPLYVASGPRPEVPLPAYYMLQLLTNCGPERQHVGFLTEGQDACGPTVPYRDIYWLDWELRSIGLLADGERLELTPEDCTLNCRLDVVRSADDSRIGSIRLETSGSFPGAVYRVNGDETPRWRLRGDLTWEQTSP